MTTPRIRFPRPSAEIFFDYKKELANSSTAQEVHAQVAGLVGLMDQGKAPYPINGVNSTNTEKLLTAMATGFLLLQMQNQKGEMPIDAAKKKTYESYYLLTGLGKLNLIKPGIAIRLGALNWNDVDWLTADWDWYSSIGVQWSQSEWAQLRAGLLDLGVVPARPQFPADLSAAKGNPSWKISSFDQGTPPEQKYLSANGVESGIKVASDGAPYVPTIIYGRRWSDIPWNLRWDEIPFDLLNWFSGGNLKFEGFGKTQTIFGKTKATGKIPTTPDEVLSNAWEILKSKCNVGMFSPKENKCTQKTATGAIYAGDPTNPYAAKINTPPKSTDFPGTGSNAPPDASGGIKIPGGGVIVGGNIGNVFNGKPIIDFAKNPADLGGGTSGGGGGDAGGGASGGSGDAVGGDQGEDPVQITSPILVVENSTDLMGKGTGGGTLLNDIENSLASKALGELGTLCLGLADAYNQYNNLPAIQIFQLWQAKGSFVVLRKGLGQQFCSEMAKYGKPSTNNQAVFNWTAYEFPKESIGSIAGDPNSFVWGLPFGDTDWSPYVQYVPTTGGGTAGTTPQSPPVIGCQQKGTVYWPGLGCIPQEKASELLKDQAKCLMTPGSTFDPSTLICSTPAGPVCPDGQPADPQTGCGRTEPPPAPEEEKKSSSTGLIIGLVAAAVAVGVVVSMSGDKEEDRNAGYPGY